MSTITGRLMFDRNRTATPSVSLAGIANVSIVLQNSDTNATLSVLTNANGEYTFNNVPNGNYQIVEAYGFMPSEETPGDFLNAVSHMLLDGGTTPPISFAINPPSEATNLDCTIPNTILVTVNNLDLANQNFLNGPVTYIPITSIMDESVIVSPINLIKSADNGTFGRYPAGKAANTGADPNPYTNLGAGFVYVLPKHGTIKPADGEYTIQNIMNEFTKEYTSWWVIADRTHGNETGRMMVINGDNPGAVIFKEVITVKPQTYYLFSSWILNIINRKSTYYALPALGVAILDEKGNELYRETLGNLIPGRETNPEWKQIGTVIHSGENTLLTVQFISMGPRAMGNDYVIDDILFNEIELSIYKPVKTVNKAVVDVGETITYTVTLEKPGHEPLTNVIFKDTLPDGIVFVPDSVVINGMSSPGINPNDGFSAPDIIGNSALTVSFSATIDFPPEPNPTLNVAHITYSYSPVEGGISGIHDVDTNEVPVKVLISDLSLTKTNNIEKVTPGDYLTYVLVAGNRGPDSADNVIIKDTLPDSLTNATFSSDGGVLWNDWTGSFFAGTLAPEKTISIIIKALVKENATATIKNTAIISSDTFDPDTDNNSSSTETIVTESADLSIEKTTRSLSIRPDEQILYTLAITNLGPSDAKNVIITDIIPSGLSNAQFSVDNGKSWKNWDGSVSVGTIASKSTFSILITAKVNRTAAGIITNTATVESSTPDPNLYNNTSTTTTIIITPMQDLFADLIVAKTASPNPCTAGGLITYSLKIMNNGPDQAVNVTLLDTVSTIILNPELSVDNGLTWIPWNGSYDIGTLANQASVDILIRGTVKPDATGVISNTATIISVTPDPNHENNVSNVETPVVKNADISVSKTASAVKINSGETLTYVITVVNNGPSYAENVIVTDIIPDGLTDVRFSVNGTVWNRWDGFHIINSLENNRSYTITVKGTVNSSFSGTIKNTVSVRSATFDPDLTNNEATATAEAAGTCDLSIVKCACPHNAIPCKPLLYKITVTNSGLHKAENVILTDYISDKISNPVYSSDNGISWHKWTGTLALGNIASNSTVTVLISGIVQRYARNEIKNTASVTSLTKDINLKNNKCSIKTKILTDC